MLRRNITYTDFNDEEHTEEFCFHLSKTELVEIEVEYEGGLTKTLENIIKTNDHKTIVAEFKRIVLLSYGKVAEDGRRFIKSDELREEFVQSPAYDVLFMELSTDANAAAEFVVGIMPGDLAEEAKKEVLKVKAAEALGTTKVASPTAAAVAAQQAAE